ncbi:helix-turn-helix transcriptional regulator [Kitasatospora sp. NPDC048540]|uniref:helix-turn-helix domain-containing protein n=1 Tax=unclassified Kitasatospora TaxID=2633591 RepID=UPI00068B2AA3|nr:helix-turn-helix transcriptional regulator [Kitasatospora sp. MBT63]
MNPHRTDGRSADPWRAFGARLRQWRRLAGLTQARLGAEVGYDHTAISRLENGTRRATLHLAHRLDALLAAGGDLLAACRAAEDWDLGGPPPPPGSVRAPLPAITTARGEPPQPPPPDALPARLPAHGLLCPLHGAAGCDVPPPAETAALHAAFCAAEPGSPRAVAEDTLHALAGLLAVHLRTGEDRCHPGTAAAVEHTLRALARHLALTPGRTGRPLARLAAEYAHAAGGLRLQHGRSATAMACFDRALTWSELAGDPVTQVAALGDMSTLARLEGDAASALGYAREIGRAAPDRHWAGAIAQVYQARAHALGGDLRETVRHIGRARLHLDHLGAGEEADVPWLSEASMQLRVESAAAAALRDAAATLGDRRLALRAADAARTALRLLGPQQLPATRLLFTLRIADCHLCAHDPHSALALLGPALEGVEGEVPALVGHELRGLATRLAAQRRHSPQLAAAARLTATLARRTPAG